MWNTQFAACTSSWFSRNFFQLHLTVSDTREIIQVCVPIRLYEQTKLCNSFLYWSSQSVQVQRQKEFKNSSYPLRKEVHRNILVKDRSEGFQKHVVCPVWVWVLKKITAEWRIKVWRFLITSENWCLENWKKLFEMTKKWEH